MLQHRPAHNLVLHNLDGAIDTRACATGGPHLAHSDVKLRDAGWRLWGGWRLLLLLLLVFLLLLAAPWRAILCTTAVGSVLIAIFMSRCSADNTSLMRPAPYIRVRRMRLITTVLRDSCS